MSNEAAIETSKRLDGFMKNLDCNKLEGHGGLFLIAPLDQFRVFSTEQFSEEQKMFAQTAREFAVNRIKPVNDELNVLNKELMSPSLEFRTDANSSFWVLARLRPSMIKSLIKGFSGSLVYILQSIFISGLSSVAFNVLLTIV